MELYVKLEFPDVQEYMEEDWFEDEAYYDVINDVYFIPKSKIYENNNKRSEDK